MKPKVCILLNSFDEFDFKNIIQRFLPIEKFEVVIVDTFPEDPLKYHIIVPWNYRKVIKQASQAGNVIVMHASDLPEGRGWAPIYYTFSENKLEYILSGIFADDDVDTGDVIVRARFPIEPDYTASFIRMLDNELCLRLVAGILEQWPECRPMGVKQVGEGSYRPRRYSVDNEIDVSQPLESLISHLRAVESGSSAFFYFKDEKYMIHIEPESMPSKPGRVIIEYPALNKTEVWSGWNDSL